MSTGNSSSSSTRICIHISIDVNPNMNATILSSISTTVELVISSVLV